MLQQKTLADLIAALELAASGLDAMARPDLVRIEWNLMRPGKWASYRGYYDQIALAFGMPNDDEIEDIDIDNFLHQCWSMVGATVHGYKGGNYVVLKSTPLWVANYGDASGVAITGFKQAAGYFLLETAIIDLD